MKKEMLSTSEKEVPKLRNALQEKYKEVNKIGEESEPLNPENIQKQKEQLPDPSGWRFSCNNFCNLATTTNGSINLSNRLEVFFLNSHSF